MKQSPRRPNTSKTQENHNEYYLYGHHAVSSALENTNRKVSCLLTTQPLSAEKVASLPKGLPHKLLTNTALEALLPPGAVHQGIALLVRPLPIIYLETWLETIPDEAPLTIVLLDQVVDPHNVGAMLRSAAAFGADAIIVTTDHAPKENAIIAKAACGALELLPIIRVTNLSRAITLLKSRNIWCLGLDGEAQHTIDRIPYFSRRALILGAEGKGLRQNTQRHVDMLVKITISEKMESLNVSNACAVALYALMHQKP